jgi:hypothetical protein
MKEQKAVLVGSAILAVVAIGFGYANQRGPVDTGLDTASPVNLLADGFPEPARRVVAHAAAPASRRCHGSTDLSLVNSTSGAVAESGRARAENEAESSAEATGPSNSGDAEAEAEQVADANSGDAIVGQVIGVVACGDVAIEATNTVEDSKAISGDVEASNVADVDARTGSSPVSSTATP